MTIEDDGERVRTVRRRTLAVVLLQRILSTRPLDVDALAEALVVNRTMMRAFLSGNVPIPLERQLCLALFVIERIPELARQGHQLRAQVTAAIAFQSHATAVHREAPPMRF